MNKDEIIISVWNCRAAVSRYEPNEGGLSVVEALNWQELEDDATSEVENQGGAVNLSGHYTCSQELCSRAQF